MGILSEITQQALARLGYSKQAQVAHVPGAPYIFPHSKTTDYMAAYKGWVYANVKRRAEQMAAISLKLMQEGRSGVVEVLDHPAVELLLRVNNQMTARELLEITYAHLDLAGEAFWYVDRGQGARGEPQAIVPLLPDRIKVVPGKDRLIDGYIYRLTDANGTPKEMPFVPEEIIFFKEPNPTNLYRGLGAVQAAAMTIDVDEDAERWNWFSFRHGTSAKPVFETDQHMDEASLRLQYTKLQEHWSGVEAANKPMILHSGLKATSIGATQKDMEYIEGQKWSRDKIMALFGATKPILGIVDDVNRSNAETSEYIFAKYMVEPRVQKVADYLNEFYLPMFKRSETLFFMIDNPVPPNVEQEVEVFSRALAGASWMTPNEVRERKGLDPIEGGDQLYAPAGMQPLGAELIAPDVPQVRFFNNRHKQIHADQMRKAAREKQLSEKFEEKFTDLSTNILKMRRTEHGDFRQRASKAGGFHDQLKQFGETQEQKFKRAIKQYFGQQEDQMVRNIQFRFHETKTWETKKPSDNFLFDVSQFKEIGLRLLLPILSETVLERGNEALFFIGSGIGFNLDNPRAQKFLEDQAGKLIKNIDETTRDELGKTLSAGLDAGEGIPELQDRVRQVFTKASDSRAEMIARTEVIKASNFASEEGWRQSGVVVGKEWLTADDERVDPLCAAMDGKVISLQGKFFNKSDQFTVEGHSTSFIEPIRFPPLHPMCRCTLIPVLKGEKKIGEVTHKVEPTGITIRDLEKLDEKISAVIKAVETNKSLTTN